MPDSLRNRARDLRAKMTDAERLIWRHLRQRRVEGCRFRRQVALGRYIADFVCLERRLIIEIDGGQHQENEEHDATRSEWLSRRGFRVLRFWNNEVGDNIEGVLERIAEELKFCTPHLDPPPQGGRR